MSGGDLMGVFGRIMAGLQGFRQAFLDANTLQTQAGQYGAAAFDEFSRIEARRLRYELLWAMYQNNTFWSKLHLHFSGSLKTDFGLYPYTRHNFNPVYRLGEFFATNLVGGTLDEEAGDGETVKSAVPIITKNERLRPAISKLWKDSQFAIQKDIWSRDGAILGDVGLKICDDTRRQDVTTQIVHPGHVKWLDRDDRKTIRGYIIEQQRYDPRSPSLTKSNPVVNPESLQNSATFTEECFIDGKDVVYRTFLNGALYNWRGLDEYGQEYDPEWRVPYGFVPLVMTQHIPVGLPFGMAEPHALLSKVFEVDDVSSNLGDYIRRLLNGPIAISGVKSSEHVSVTKTEATVGNPQPGRTMRPMMYLPEGAEVQHLLQELDLAGVSEHIKALNSEIERDYPELQMDIWATGDPSGRALRVARQRTEQKVQTRRTTYDTDLARAQRIALAIGGIRGYPGYEGLGVDDPMDPLLDHSIGHRPVFAPDPLDDIEEGQAFWGMVGSAVTAGMPLEVILEREGWPAADIAKVVKAKEDAANKAMDQVKQKQKLAMADTGPGVAE